jgi:hypothetical protein
MALPCVRLEKWLNMYMTSPSTRNRKSWVSLCAYSTFYTTHKRFIRVLLTFSHSFISFYPFCAVFSLYEHILACTNPDDCEQDVQLLENLGAAMADASAVWSDFIPFARTINALNKVSRSFQDDRRRVRAANPAAGEMISPMPDFDMSAFASFSDITFNFDETAHPLGFVRALENDFTARNWHEGWWDAAAGVDNQMAGDPRS